MIFLILVFLLGGLWETEAISVTGVFGDKVTIKCSHSNAYYNIKYFCKGECQNEVLISSKDKDHSNEKYSIVDEGNTFSVTIFHLTEDDSGTYWCGIERLGVDTYNKVVLQVIKESKKDSDNTTSSSNRLVYVGAGLGLVVLALAMVLLIFFRHRNRGIHTSSGKNPDTYYATVGDPITSFSSTANESQEADGRTDGSLSQSTVQHQEFRGAHSDNIYSNISVSSVSQIPPDGLLYTTVIFNKHKDSSTYTPGTAALTYSSIKHEAADTSEV